VSAAETRRHVGPLSGYCGIVLTQAWAGTYCTELMALMGADVIQVEVRKRLDSWRGGYDSPMAAGLTDVATAEHPWNCSPNYNSVNLNKRCVTLDLSEPDGVELLRVLLRHADFCAENFSPRVLGNLGISYEQMREVREDLILISLSAYGHVGPWANVPGIGGTIEPTSGMSALLGYRDGPPLNSGFMYPDPVAGAYGFAALVAALHHRERTGQGQYIDLSMQEANLTFVGDAAIEERLTRRQRPRAGNRHPQFAPHGIFPSAGDDRWIALAAESEEQWQALDGVAGLGWAADPRFADNAARKTNEDALEAEIATWTSREDRDALANRLSTAGVIAAPVLEPEEVVQDAGMRERGTLVEIDHPEAGRWIQAANPVRFSRTPASEAWHAPLQGEHSREVLRDLAGVDDTRYDELVAANITGQGAPE
jgi:crotonobetainyl-CoA:carnitine CoA-transferase CaiB-like acyl-CoA transferase